MRAYERNVFISNNNSVCQHCSDMKYTAFIPEENTN